MVLLLGEMVNGDRYNYKYLVYFVIIRMFWNEDEYICRYIVYNLIE